jgi:hypothetical protein
MFFSNRELTEEGINHMNSYAEISLQICKNHSLEERIFDVALEKVDIGYIFQYPSFCKNSKLKMFFVKLI